MQESDITLLHEGVTLAPELFANPGPNPDIFCPESERIAHHLDQGCAMLITHAERWFPPLMEMATTLGENLDEAVTVNVYLGGPESKGFGLHIDHHDVLVMQAEGHKQWELRAPTFPAPLLLPDHMTEPPADILWQGVLENGDILYLPRGYWHQARATHAASLHFTFGIQPCTGLHFLAWVRKKLMADSRFRAEMPRYNKQEMKSYLENLQIALAKLHTKENIELFLEERGTRIRGARKTANPKRNKT